MNTRQAIQPSNTPQVLSLAFSSSKNRFIAGLSDSLRVFRTDNCLTTYDPAATNRPTSRGSGSSLFDGGIAIAEALDDRYIAFVAGGRRPAGRESVVVFWDCLLEREVNRFDFGEPVKGVRLSGKWMAVVLLERCIVFAYQELLFSSPPTPPPDTDADEDDDQTPEQRLIGPNKLHALHPTSSNPFALASLTPSLLALPAQTVGQIHLIPLPSGPKRVLRAHNTSIRCLALSPSGNLLATTSEQGTLVRVFNTDPKGLGAMVAEFRRGVEKAVVLGLAFSEGERWVGVTSDKGTVHIFDLKPEPPVASSDAATTSTSVAKPQQQHRKPTQSHRLSAGTTSSTREKLSSLEGRSSPVQPGSIQEYYTLLPPPIPPPHSSTPIPSALTSLKQSPWSPRLLRDTRSVASAPFYLSSPSVNETPYWQGGTPYSWTTAPDGTRKRVRNPVPSLPADPGGRALKGVLAFAAGNGGREEADGAVIYVLGGGVEGRWEVFDLVKGEGAAGTGWVLVRRGFRRFMGKVFVD